MALSSMSCNGTMNQTKQNGQISSQDTSRPGLLQDSQPGRDIFEKDTALQALRAERRNERLSEKGDDSAIIASMEALAPRANSSTAIFSIDENTGQVKGCPMVKLREVYEEKDYGKIRSTGANIEFSSLPAAFRQSIKSKIKPLLAEAGFQPEPEEEAKNPESYITNLFQLDNSYLAALGDPHGGGIKMLLFFDRDGAGLKHTIRLDAELPMPIFYINKPKSHIGLSSGVSSPFYVFNSSGGLLIKGDFNEYTGDSGTSYGPVVVSDRFEYMMLANNISYLYKGKNEVLKTVGHSFYIDDSADILSYGSGRHRWVIQNINTKEIAYQMDNPNLRMLFNNSGQYFFQSTTTKKIYLYEVQ